MKMSRCIFFNFLCLTILFFKVSGKHDDVSLNVYKRSLKESTPHSLETYENCSLDFMQRFSKVMSDSVCKPRPHLVNISPSSPNLIIIPTMAVVNRCDGMCLGKQACFALESKIVPIMTQQLDLFHHDSWPTCGVVQIEEHVTCGCKCSVKALDCSEKQVFYPNECMCVCQNLEEETSCLKEGKTWDNIQCSC